MRKPYVRPMTDWWRRDPFFMRYMWREATAFGVAAYALVLLVGVWRLAQGEGAFDAWLRALQSWPSVAFHGVLLAAMVWHAWTWFEIMPKTMPMLHLRGERIPPRIITRTGVAAAALASLALFASAWLLP
jgi:fumarate reductase subunit C